MSAVRRPMSIFICKTVCLGSFGYGCTFDEASHTVKPVGGVCGKIDLGHTEDCFFSHCSRLSRITVKISRCSISMCPLEIDLDHCTELNSARTGSYTRHLLTLRGVALLKFDTETENRTFRNFLIVWGGTVAPVTSLTALVPA